MKTTIIILTTLAALTISAQQPRRCVKCAGSGSVWTVCRDCGGSGRGEYVDRWSGRGNRHGYRAQCRTCGGTIHRGKVKTECPLCAGSGYDTNSVPAAVESPRPASPAPRPAVQARPAGPAKSSGPSKRDLDECTMKMADGDYMIKTARGWRKTPSIENWSLVKTPAGYVYTRSR